MFGGLSVGGGYGGGRSFTMFGWMLAILSVASLAVAVANTAYTYIKYNDDSPCKTGSKIITTCLTTFVYISSGIWGSIPVFITAILALRLGVLPGIMRLFQVFAIVSLLVFTPAMMVIYALEIVAGNDVYYTISSSGITNDVAKFILPLVVAILAAIEFLVLLLMLCYMYMNRNAGIIGGGAVIGGGDFIDDGGYGGGDFMDGDFGYGDGGYGFEDGGFIDDGGYGGFGGGYGGFGGGSGGGSGGGAGGAGGAGGSAAASSGGGGSGSSSNNNNNNIVVPPVIFPPQPAAPAAYPMPFPIYLPAPQASNPNNPVIVTTNTTPSGGVVMGPNTAYGPVVTSPQAPGPIVVQQPPAPQPIFLPLPARKRCPPPRPVLRPLPPTRYYPHRRFGAAVTANASGSYMGGFGAPPFSGKPWDRY